MSMLDDRDRHLLDDLERQLQQEDAAWMRQFKDSKAPRQARHDLQLATAIGLLVVWPRSLSCWASPSVR